MKSLTAIFCFFALACNTALASVGGIVYCIDKDTKEACRTSAAESSDHWSSCCPFEQARKSMETTLPFECEQCIDYEINASEDDEATLSFERIAVKAPFAIEWTPLKFEIVCVESKTTKQFSARAPPIQQSASQQYANTVLFRV